MNRGPYRRPTRRDVDQPTHLVGDLVIVAGTRWIIRSIRDQDVTLVASSSAGRWTTTLDKLPSPERTHR